MKQGVALKILKTGENIFLTGSAGTGKTYLLNQYLEYLRERKIKPSVVAPTGIAASHLDGSTIHSFFGLGIRSFVDDYFLDSLLQKKYLVDRFNKLEILIIDEVSMISPEIFLAMDKILKAFKFTDEPFGGIQLILSGDFFQLPPISRDKKEKRFAWQSPIWKDLDLKTCYLEQNFRQNDKELSQILNDIRSGEISESSYDIFRSRQNVDLDKNFRLTKLYTHNIDVDRINDQELKKLEEKSHIFHHKRSGAKKNTDKIFKTSMVKEEIVLKKGAIVLFIKNNYDKGYINGTTGKIVEFDEDDGFPIVEIFSGRRIKASMDDWNFESDNGNIIASVSQVPLKLAWAITIHKSQGMTLDSAEIDLSKTFETGQGYVALSRLKNIDGLRLVGFNEMALKVDGLILQINDRMKMASKRASTEISKFSKKELEKKFENNIFNKGGIIKKNEIKKEKIKITKEKKNREKQVKDKKIEFFREPKILGHKRTSEFLEQSKDISELAKNRELTEGSIIKHLAYLKKEKIDIEKFKPKEKTIKRVYTAIKKIKKDKNSENFLENGKIKMKAIFNVLGGDVSYNEIKLSLVFGDFL